MAKTYAFSENILVPIKQDSIVYVTTSELKYANLIFAEHKKLLTENSLLNEQVDNLNNLNEQLEQIDSLRVIQLSTYSKLNQEYLEEIRKKNRIIKGWQIGGVTVTIGLVLFLLFK